MKTAIATALLLAVSVFAAAQQSAYTDLPAGVPYPRLVRADVPFYPAAAWSAHFGSVEIEVTVKDGKVIKAHVQRARVEQGSARETRDKSKLAEYLSMPSLENVKTWRFVPDGLGLLSLRTLTASKERKHHYRRTPRCSLTLLGQSL